MLYRQRSIDITAYAHVKKGLEVGTTSPPSLTPQFHLLQGAGKRDYILRPAKMPETSSIIELPTDTGSNRGARVHFYYNDTQPEKVIFPIS